MSVVGSRTDAVYMSKLRIVVIVMFFLSVAITVWSLLPLSEGGENYGVTDSGATYDEATIFDDKHSSSSILGFAHSGGTQMSALHIAHIAMVTLTFLLIAFYLVKSAQIASLRIYRELRLRMTVDPSAAFVEHLPTGDVVLNTCVGMMAKKSIFVMNAGAMERLAKIKSISPQGSIKSREGYEITKATLAEMGVELSDTRDGSEVKIAFGPFELPDNRFADFVLINNRITHLLTAVYISRMYVKYRKISKILLSAAIVCVLTLFILEQFTYAGAVVAFWAASGVIVVRQIENKTSKLSFKSVTDKKR